MLDSTEEVQNSTYKLPIENYDIESGMLFDHDAYNSLYRKDRERSASYSSSTSGDSLNSPYSPLKSKHLEEALNSGVFSQVSSQGKKERMKNHKLNKRTSCDDLKTYRKDNAEFHITDRKRSQSMITTLDKEKPHRYQIIQHSPSYEWKFYQNNDNNNNTAITNKDRLKRKKKKQSKEKLIEKFKKDLSNSGLLLNTNNIMSLDEIHDLQVKFYTGINLTRQLSVPEETHATIHEEEEEENERPEDILSRRGRSSTFN